ncbi:hypothetical protein MTO96_025300 [Rhipicephalus appendiculatus]
MYDITEDNIYFNRSYYYKRNKTSYSVEGTFFPYKNETTVPDTILIGGPGLLKEGYEWLKYVDENYTCGVFNITINWGDPYGITLTWFDLRVINSSIKTGPTQDCQNQYKNYTRKQQPSETIYFNSCQDIFAQKTDSSIPHYNRSDYRSL